MRSNPGKSGLLEPQIWPKLLVEMPTDVLYQIFQWLEPRDILTLADNVNVIQTFLASADANALWKFLFENNPIAKDCPAPPRPELVSHQQWADLLYAPLVCQLCGRSASVPDFCILRRLCEDECLANPEKMIFFREMDDKLDTEPIWDMVPYTTVKRYESSKFVTIRRYWKDDFDAVQRDLSAYDSPNAPKASDTNEAFISRRKSYVEALLKHSHMCIGWLGHLNIQAESMKREKRTKFVNDMRTRCIDHGYLANEVDSGMNRLYRLDPDYELTDSKWELLLPQVIAILAPIQKTRRVDNETLRIQRRKELVSRAYTSYLNTLPARKWHCTPFEEAVLQDLYVLIHDRSDQTLDNPKFKETQLYPRFAEFCRAEAQRMRRQLESDIVKSGVLDGKEGVPKADLIDRAFAVFVCPNLKGKPRRLHCLIAWDGIWSTINYLNQPLRTIRFATKGFQAVLAIAELMERDPMHLMASEMDRLDIRLICNGCPLKSYDGFKGREVLTWREYVEHFTDSSYWSPLGHSSPNISILNVSVAADIRKREDPDAINSDCVWSCNHCAAHFRNYTTRANVCEHLNAEHGIPQPKDDEDLVLMNIPRAPREPVAISLEPLNNLVCVMCPLSETTYYSLPNITTHLYSVHNIGEDSSCSKLFYEAQFFKASTGSGQHSLI
ncbi:F-box domain-containing protein [Pleurotus pulmonarius]|nr:hypothetical protein EYR36_003264 [Pleurotus pulmonarius]